jgi:stress response protein YsnF
MPEPEDAGETRIPIVEERARIEKQVVPTGRVRIASRVDERLEVLRDELIAQTVTVDRISIDREVDTPPEIRSDGDVLIIPVVEQRLVVEKRWVLKEELHVRRREHSEAVEVPVELRSTRVSVERAEAAQQSNTATD